MSSKLKVDVWGEVPISDANYVMNDIACRNMASTISVEAFRTKNIWLKNRESLESLIYQNLKRSNWNKLGVKRPKLRRTA